MKSHILGPKQLLLSAAPPLRSPLPVAAQTFVASINGARFTYFDMDSCVINTEILKAVKNVNDKLQTLSKL